MTAHKHAAILAQAAEEEKPAKPREWVVGHLHMIEVTPEVRAALAAAGIEVSP